MRLSTLTLAALALLAPFATANAAPQQVQAGVLQCQGGENVGFVVGSVARLECVFQSGGRRPEPYLATVKRIGVDLGFTGQTQLAWAVSAPTTLAGSSGGVGVNASVGLGAGGNFLFGGPNNAYALQPISLQGQTGLNVAAGIAGIDLEPVRTSGPRRHHRHHRHHHHH
jgi:hypothetical protein